MSTSRMVAITSGVPSHAEVPHDLKGLEYVLKNNKSDHVLKMIEAAAMQGLTYEHIVQADKGTRVFLSLRIEIEKVEFSNG